MAEKREGVIPTGGEAEVEGSACQPSRHRHPGRKADSSTPLRFGRNDNSFRKGHLEGRICRYSLGTIFRSVIVALSEVKEKELHSALSTIDSTGKIQGFFALIMTA
jgi:hypothetical protein